MIKSADWKTTIELFSTPDSWRLLEIPSGAWCPSLSEDIMGYLDHGRWEIYGNLCFNNRMSKLFIQMEPVTYVSCRYNVCWPKGQNHPKPTHLFSVQSWTEALLDGIVWTSTDRFFRFDQSTVSCIQTRLDKDLAASLIAHKGIRVRISGFKGLVKFMQHVQVLLWFYMILMYDFDDMCNVCMHACHYL